MNRPPLFHQTKRTTMLGLIAVLGLIAASCSTSTTTTTATTATTIATTTTTDQPTTTSEAATTTAATTTTTTAATTTTVSLPVIPGSFSKFDGAGALVWEEMDRNGEIVACRQGMVLFEDSFCLSDGFEFSSDYERLLNTRYLVAHLTGGEGLVLQGGGFTSRAGGDILLGWITLEKFGGDRVITHLDTEDSDQTDDEQTTANEQPAASTDASCRVGMTLRPGDSCEGDTFTIRIDNTGAAVFDGSVGGIQMGNTVFDAPSLALNNLRATRDGTTWTIESLP